MTINVGEANDVITVCPPGSKVQWVLPLMLVYPLLLIERIYSADAQQEMEFKATDLWGQPIERSVGALLSLWKFNI